MPNDSDLASRRILSVTEEELSRIVLDIHDGPVQYLFASLSLLASLQHECQSYSLIESSEILPRLNRVAQMVEASLREIKSFLGTFRPPEFQRRSLLSIVEGLVIQHEQLTNNTVELTNEGTPDDVALPVKIALYRILQEALSNGFRHAGVDQHWVRLWSEDEQVCLEVVDKGRGFEPPPLEGPLATEHAAHIGLRGMRDRVKLLGGEFHLTSQRDKGTRITVKVPAHV